MILLVSLGTSFDLEFRDEVRGRVEHIVCEGDLANMSKQRAYRITVRSVRFANTVVRLLLRAIDVTKCSNL